MSRGQSTRRAFLKGGALAAAPLAAAGAAALAATSEHEARLARPEAEAAIRDLHQAWLRKVNAGERAEAARLHESVSRVETDHDAAPDEITVAADGRSASGRYACMVETETPLAKDCTLAQMRHAQGEGSLQNRERRGLTAGYVKGKDGWAISAIRFEPA